MKNYPKMLCFYLLELFSSSVNLVCALVGKYPSFEWGVSFLFDLEQHRIVSEVDNREAIRKKKEDDASKLEKKAKDNGEYL
tara:strand:- start:2666 stop:2908 length:243 start_codon:yes stop_codon:yes gene_type:complete